MSLIPALLPPQKAEHPVPVRRIRGRRPHPRARGGLAALLKAGSWLTNKIY